MEFIHLLFILEWPNKMKSKMTHFHFYTKSSVLIRLSFGVFRFGNEIVIHASDATVDETVGETEADHDVIKAGSGASQLLFKCCPK